LFSLSASANGDLSGADNAVTAAVLAGLSPEQARGRLEQIADFAELDEAILREPLRTYSEGMKLRLAFAAAATTQPELLLIDEVLAVGDIGFQEKCLSHLEQLRDRGCALLVASHVMDHLHRLATGVVWLRGGKVHAKGDANELLDTYERSQDDKGGPPQPLSGGGYRRGDGQVLIDVVSCIASQDTPAGTTRLGAGLTVRLAYRRDAPVTFAHFSVSLRRVGTDLRLVDVTTGASGGGTVLLQDSGTVTLTLDRLDLEPGDYWVDTGVYSEDWETVYDYRWDSVHLAVLGSSTNGWVQPPHRWNTA
jgi:lipopolysaccharide transport system ATP-binding protein